MWSCRFVAILIATGGWSVTAACAPEFTSVPDDASVKLTFPKGRHIPAFDTTQDSLPVVAEVRIGTGELAGKDWRVELSADIGGFASNSTASAAVITTTDNGTATAFYFPTRDTGWVHLTVIGGGLKSVDSVHVDSSRGAPASSRSSAPHPTG